MLTRFLSLTAACASLRQPGACARPRAHGDGDAVPGVTRTTDMKAAAAAGIFQYQCDYQDHYLAGMQARLVVT